MANIRWNMTNIRQHPLLSRCPDSCYGHIDRIWWVVWPCCWLVPAARGRGHTGIIYAGTPGTITVPVVPTLLLPVPAVRRFSGVGRGVEMTKDGLLASSQVRSRGYGTTTTCWELGESFTRAASSRLLL